MVNCVRPLPSGRTVKISQLLFQRSNARVLPSGVQAGPPSDSGEPFLLVHGTEDKLVAYDQSLKFQSALREAGVSCDLITVADGGHGMASWDKRALSYKDGVLSWLNQHLKK